MKETSAKCGFTLLEMLVVIGIIAILAGILLTTFSGSSDSAQAAKCLNNMRSLSNAVIAYASADGHYPAAASYTYLDISKGKLKKHIRKGWIGPYQNEQSRVIGPYYDDDGEMQYHAITNGVIWHYIKGGRNSYSCPVHVLECHNKHKLTPAWSYVMNSYFGWQYKDRPAPTSDQRHREANKNLPFHYRGSGESDNSSSRDPSKVLLFAELPFMTVDGVQEPTISKGTGQEFDPALQYSADGESGLNESYCCAASGASESIGFNHRAGKKGDYMAHVAFADGHVEKIPLRGGESDVKELTTILCVGHGYTLGASNYEKAE